MCVFIPCFRPQSARYRDHGCPKKSWGNPFLRKIPHGKFGMPSVVGHLMQWQETSPLRWVRCFHRKFHLVSCEELVKAKTTRTVSKHVLDKCCQPKKGTLHTGNCAMVASGLLLPLLVNGTFATQHLTKFRTNLTLSNSDTNRPKREIACTILAVESLV